MKRTLIALIAVVGMATAANAATLSVTADASSYNVSDTITLTVVGDAEGASSVAAFANLLFGGSGSVEWQSASQNTQTSFGGGLMWSTGALTGSDVEALAINQLAGLMPLAPDNQFVSTIVLHASGAGSVSVDFEGVTGSPTSLDFFGLTGGAGTQFSISIVPEPTTAGLLGLGLLGLAVAGRRR